MKKLACLGCGIRFYFALISLHRVKDHVTVNFFYSVAYKLFAYQENRINEFTFLLLGIFNMPKQYHYQGRRNGFKTAKVKPYHIELLPC